MAQRRMLYSSLWQNEDFSKLSDKGKILYIGLITLADDHGRLKSNPSILRSQIFLYDESIKNSEISKLLQDISKIGLILLYENDEYIQHPNWFKFQILRKDRMGKSMCPSPDNQMTDKWQPSDGQLPAEVSKQVSNISKKDLQKYKPSFLKK